MALDIASLIQGIPLPVLILLGVLMIWTMIWKGIALWTSARKNHIVWFIIFVLPINTAGILEILYIFLFSGFSYKVKGKSKK